jgi:hypothetical protein
MFTPESPMHTHSEDPVTFRINKKIEVLIFQVSLIPYERKRVVVEVNKVYRNGGQKLNWIVHDVTYDRND